MYLEVNQNILIDIINEDEMCKSTIAEIGEKEILISFPMAGNIAGLLSTGTPIVIIFMYGSDQFRFRTEILGRKVDKIPLFRILRPNQDEIQKIQRRENFRVMANLKLTLGEHYFNTINISAGGVLFSCDVNYDIKMGEAVSGMITVPSINSKVLTPVHFQARVTRVLREEKNDRKKVALEYTELKQQDQMKLTQYCFERQKQLRLMQK
jgi:c-di-GMP-binding flagellar brake protein YcgR